MNPFITLSPADLRLCCELAWNRYSTDRQIGARDLLQGDNSRKREYEILGVAGELVFAKWTGLPFDANSRLIPGAPDFVISSCRIDVKTSSRPNGDLVIPLSCRRGRANVYFYVNGSGRTFEIVGFIPEVNAFQDRYLTNLGYGPCRVIPRSDLYAPAQLRAFIRQFSLKNRKVSTWQSTQKLNTLSK